MSPYPYRSDPDPLHAAPAARRACDPAPGPDEIGEAAYFHDHFREAAYYSTGRDWGDYGPAYRYGAAMHAAHRGYTFETVEAVLAAGWNAIHGHSRLTWPEARGAMLDAWRRIDEAAPGPVARPADDAH